MANRRERRLLSPSSDLHVHPTSLVSKLCKMSSNTKTHRRVWNQRWPWARSPKQSQCHNLNGDASIWVEGKGALLYVLLPDAQFTQCSNSWSSDRDPCSGSPRHFSVLLHLPLHFVKSSLGKGSKMTPAATQGKQSFHVNAHDLTMQTA